MSCIMVTQLPGERGFMSFTFTFNDTILGNLTDFAKSDHFVKIGVLAESPKRKNELSKKWNKENKKVIDAVALAMVHEFGSQSRNIPQRSFLQKTLFNYKSKWKEDLAAHRTAAMEQIANGQAIIFLNEVGAKWVNWVDDTFDREGPGWQGLSERRLAERKKTGRAQNNVDPERWPLLSDTGQMRRSIMYEVV